MTLETLGYNEKWLEYGLLDKEILKTQLAEFEKGYDVNIEHYRYATFLHWRREKEYFSDLEISHFIELALEDTDKTMSGSAVKELITSSKITNSQFHIIQKEFVKFGDWTEKVIQREILKRNL